MRKAFPFLITILFSIAATAQTIPFITHKSEVFTDEFRRSSIVLAEEDGKGGLLVVRSYEGGGFSFNRGYYFEKYDTNLKLVKTQDYDMESPASEKYSKVLGLFNDGVSVHLIEMHFNIKIDAYVCTMHSLDVIDFKSKKQELFKLTIPEMEQYGYLTLRELFFGSSYNALSNDTNGSFFYDFGQSDLLSSKSGMDTGGNSNGLSIAVNGDKTAFAIALDLSARKSETLKVFLFDNSGNKITEQYFQPGLKDKKFNYQSLNVAPDGKTAYLLGKAYTKASKKKDEGGKYEYQLTAFNRNGQQTQNFDTGEHFVSSLKILLLEDRMACIGFYSDEKDNRYKGICFFDMNKAALLVNKATYSPFPSQFLIDKYGEEKQKELKYLTFRSFLQTKNHEIIFNAEEYYQQTTYTAGGPGMAAGAGGSQTSYHYDDIVCARITADGALVWARNINKRQATDGSDSAYLSYSSMLKDDDTYFFINAAEKVRKISNDRIEFKGARKSKSNLNIIRVSKNGVFDYQEVLDNEQNEVPFMVSQGFTNNGAEYFLGRKGKNKQLLKITF